MGTLVASGVLGGCVGVLGGGGLGVPGGSGLSPRTKETGMRLADLSQ